ncbi:zinc finger protein [Loa loa]|uniref:Zinc finger protein n=1 Tax=Loa loa TaxID=7209 RepID=A0A1S0UCM6_LOALO|nr:zinc finger protein [Loa loa]EJD73339.1 zinc finger protein [Loa loa]
MNVFQNRGEITRINMYFNFIYFAFFFLQLSSIETTETQTEQTEPLDLSLQKLSREQAPDLCLLAEVADKMPKAEVANKNTDEFDSQNPTVKMNLTVKEDSVKRKRAEEIAGKESKKKKLLCDKCGNSVIDINRHMMTHTEFIPMRSRTTVSHATKASLVYQL